MTEESQLRAALKALVEATEALEFWTDWLTGKELEAALNPPDPGSAYYADRKEGVD